MRSENNLKIIGNNIKTKNQRDLKNVLVVYKKSLFEIYSNSDDSKVLNYVKTNLVCKDSHDIQKKSLESVLDTMNNSGLNYDCIYRADLDIYPASKLKSKDLVISLGGDGTFLEVAHYLNDIPLLGVNSNSQTSEGFFCCARPENLMGIFDNYSKEPFTVINRLSAKINNVKIPEQVLNDIYFHHEVPAAGGKYNITAGYNDERHRESGVLICTPAGSTAWMFNEDGIIMPLSSDKIQYKNLGKRNSKPQIIDSPIKITSYTREGMVYIDGHHLHYPLSLNDVLTVENGTPITVVGDLNFKQQLFKMKNCPEFDTY